MFEEPAYRVINPAPLAYVVVLGLCGDIFLNLAAVFFFGWQRLLHAAQPTVELAGGQLALNAFSILSTVQIFIVVGLGVLVLRWIYRVNQNAHTLANGMEFTPLWAVAWYFVPLAMVWMPYRAMLETWQVSAEPKDWPKVQAPPVLRLWWGLWVFGILISLFTLQVASGDNVNRTELDLLQIVASLVSIQADLAFILVVRGLTALQVDALRGRVV